jgi:hypothetical protein
MILTRQNADVDTTTKLVEGIITALSSHCLPWLDPNWTERIIETGLNDFDTTEMKWFSSLTRNSKAILASRISTQFVKMKAWDGPGYARQLQVVIRILSYIQEFRRLHDVLRAAIANNFRDDTLSQLVTAVATWGSVFEGMGVLPSLVSAIVPRVILSLSILMIVERDFRRREANFPLYHGLERSAYSR